MRYSFYEREDAAMLAPGADPAERRDWLAAIGAQIACLLYTSRCV